MIAPTQIMKPKNWQDFEKLCKLLWGEIWNCSDSIKHMVDKVKPNMGLTYMLMWKNTLAIVVFSVKARMITLMLS